MHRSPPPLPQCSSDNKAASHVFLQAALDGKGLSMTPKVPVEGRRGHPKVGAGGREEDDELWQGRLLSQPGERAGGQWRPTLHSTSALF